MSILGVGGFGKVELVSTLSKIKFTLYLTQFYILCTSDLKAHTIVLNVRPLSLQVKSEKLGLDKSYALKQMKKHFIEETKQIEHVKNERNILMQTDCNFIIK